MFYCKFIPIFLIIMITACKIQEVRKEGINGDNEDLKNALWIEDGRNLPDIDSLFYDDHPAPLFRKEFHVKEGLISAKLCITAAGYYLAFLNGERTGENYVDPAWTDYSKRIYYSEYDLTSSVTKGINCIGVTTGNGFYNPLPLRMWGQRNLRKVLPVGNPVFIASLKLSYSDGNSEEIITDSSWRYSYGPVVKNNVYLGEVYDARKEIPDWSKPGFADTSWIVPAVSDGPGGSLQKAFFPPVQITGIITPLEVSSLPDGRSIIDMGVNFTGIYRIRLRGQTGDTVTLRFGERLYENGELNTMTAVCGQIKRPGMGGPGAPDTAWQTDTYIFGDESDIWYQPEFTYHIYRYMDITGLKYRPEILDVQGLVFNTNVEHKNSFSCSSGLLNDIQDATVRTFLANLISVQTDCPGRERFGYGGDLNAIIESYIYNFDMQSFYRKTVYDWIDAMNDSIFIDTAPYVGIEYCGLSWESGFLITQYFMYLYYNNIEFVREIYPKNLEWMEKAERLHPSGLVDSGLGDHESLEKVPVELTGTTHYLHCVRIMKLFSTLMRDRKNQKKFEKLEEKLQTVIRERCWEITPASPMNKQTLFSSLLYYKVLFEDEQSMAVDSIFKYLKESPEGHFTTGIFGTKYILEALSEMGYADTVFKIVNSRSYPGWGYMIDRGATTIWETWKESDNVYSNCHPMFGSVTEWFYRWLGGIRPDPDHPGFKRFLINPCLPEGLDSVHCVYHSPMGKIISRWTKYENDRQEYEIAVPGKSRAIARLPVNASQEVKVTDQRGKTYIFSSGNNNHHTEINLKPGTYVIEVSN